MENNELQLPLEEQLKKLKEEQEEAKRICDERIEMGMLYHDSASVQDLAAEILARKIKIQELEEQIAQKGATESDKSEKKDEKALTEYKPKMNMLQWIKSKFNKIKESMEESRKARMNKLKNKVDSPGDRFEKIVDQKTQEKNQWKKDLEVKKEDLEPDQLTAEELDNAPGYSQEYIDLHSNPKKNETDSYLEI